MNLIDELQSGDMPDHTTGPKPVSGRVAHIDADFMAYIIACDTVAERAGEKPMRDIGYKYGQIENFADYIARRAQASSYVLHVTPSGSTKGGRNGQAVQQEYQANRKGKEAPADLAKIRAYIGEMSGRAIAHFDQEADDGLAQANYNDPKNSVICSEDKDLRMVPGLHMDMKTNEIIDVPFNTYGSVSINETPSGKKVVGYGPAFFFAQCLMGDSADNIKGLPAVPAAAWQAVTPTQAYLKAIDGLAEATREDNPEKIKQAVLRRQAQLIKTKPCGPVMTASLLKDIDNVRDAYQFVKAMYVDLTLEHDHQFVHWANGQHVSPTVALLGEMQLLWMRRNKDPRDCISFIKENM